MFYQTKPSRIQIPGRSRQEQSKPHSEPKPRSKPEWNSFQNDHSKYALSPSELEKRHNLYSPRPRTGLLTHVLEKRSQPLSSRDLPHPSDQDLNEPSLNQSTISTASIPITTHNTSLSSTDPQYFVPQSPLSIRPIEDTSSRQQSHPSRKNPRNTPSESRKTPEFRRHIVKKKQSVSPSRTPSKHSPSHHSLEPPQTDIPSVSAFSEDYHDDHPSQSLSLDFQTSFHQPSQQIHSPYHPNVQTVPPLPSLPLSPSQPASFTTPFPPSHHEAHSQPQNSSPPPFPKNFKEIISVLTETNTLLIQRVQKCEHTLEDQVRMNHQLTLQLQEKETSQLQFNRNQILSESLEQKQLQKKRDEEFRILLNQVDVMQREISDLNDRIEQEDTHWKEQKQLTNSAFELIHEMKLENDALRARLAQRETKDETVQPTRTPAKPSRPLLTNLSPPDSPHTHRSPLSHERQPMFRDTHQGQDQVTDPLHDVTPTEVSTSQPPLVTSEIPYTTFPNHSSKPNINMSDLSYLVGASTPHRTTTHPHENIDSDSDYEEISEYEEIEEEISETDDDSLPPQHSSFRQSPIHTISASPFDTVPELSQEESLQLLKKFAQLQKS